jgi:hypothetical protein
VSSIIIQCPNCYVKNRIPSARIGGIAKCGACGRTFRAENPLPKCQLCHKSISGGVKLSNSLSVHQACLEAHQNRISDIKNKLNGHEAEIRSIQFNIDSRDSLGFKLVAFFREPKIEFTELQTSLAREESAFSQAKKSLTIMESKISSIYDYFLTYPPDWDKRKKTVIQRDGKMCDKCRSSLILHLHHLKPLSKGGSNKVQNLKLLCENCHSKEHGGRDFSSQHEDHETAFSKRVSNIHHAIDHRKKIKFGYKKPTDKGYKQRTVSSLKMENMDHYIDDGSTLCVRGYCELRKAERVFALKRMRGLKVI